MKSSLSRRTALMGLGAGAFASRLLRAVRAEAAPAPRQKLAFFFHANGSHHAWTPTGDGAAFVLQPHQAALEPVRNDILVLRGLTLQRGGGNAHKASTLSALGAGAPTSFDQVMAQALSKTGDSALPSLELAIGYTGGGGGKAPSLSQVNGVFLPGERNPVAAYQRIAARFSGGGPMTSDPAAMEKTLVARRSVLDYLREETAGLQRRLGAGEKPKLDLYLDGLRDLEKSLGAYAGEVRASAACGKAMPPAPDAGLDSHVSDLPKVSRLFLDIMALALACGVTRVASMMWGGGESDEDVGFMGIHDWHITTHANPAGPKGDQIIKMQNYLAGEYAYFIGRLKAFGDGPGTLFDSTLALWGTQNGNTNQTNFSKEDHDRHNTPFVLAGRGGGAFRPGRTIDCNGANHNDLYIAIANAFGVDLKTVGDPTWCRGPLAGVVG
ncbi:MAG TPA: DUF1552 domain-containing protein [Polyangia bacterium]|nr:DUF1552 domain-containing protein [Polyangia bacterium]